MILDSVLFISYIMQPQNDTKSTQIGLPRRSVGTQHDSCVTVIEIVSHNGTVRENVQYHCRYTNFINACKGLVLLLIFLVILAIVFVILARATGVF